MNERLHVDEVKKYFNFQKTIKRGELKAFYIQIYPQLKETTFRWMLYDLKKAKVISALERGVFMLYDSSEGDLNKLKASELRKQDYQPTISKRLEDIYICLRKQFPYLNICIWDTRWLNEFMVHQPGKFFTIIETESETEEAVFYYLRSMFENIYIKPTHKEMEWYVFENVDSVIIKKLVSQAPVTKKTPIVTPTIEKILVDLFSEKNFFYPYQGQELVNIFENVFRYYKVYLPKLYRYAGRRKCTERLKIFIKEQINDM